MASFFRRALALVALASSAAAGSLDDVKHVIIFMFV
jgi:phospholipase C